MSLFVVLLLQAAPAADVDGYERTVVPFFDSFCLDCHDDEAKKGKLSLERIDPNLLGGADFETWRIIEEQLTFKDMPPPKKRRQPTDAQRNAVLDWIRGELLKGQLPGVLAEEKLLLPEYGNYVDHHALFGKRRDHVIPAGPRLWRLRPEIYNSLAPRLGENIRGLANALNRLDGPEFKDYSAPYFLDEASTIQLLSNAKLIAAAQLSPKSKERVFKKLVEDTPPAAETVKGAIQTAFRKALGRGPTDAEMARFLGFYEKSKATSSHQVAAKALLTAVLLQPEFMFRQELGEGDPDRHGRVRLSQREIGYALSYALSNVPLRAFDEAVAKGKLATRDQVAAVVRAQLKDDSKDYDKNPRVMQFFREYFDYPNAGEVFKDKPPGGVYEPGLLVGDLEFTIREILRRDKDVFAELLTTRKYYVNAQWGRKKEADKLVRRHTKHWNYPAMFNLPLDWRWAADLQPVTFPKDERAGLLTHPAWLAAWSGNFDNHPVQRGKWIRTHLLGGTVPDVPIGVDARVPEREHTTFRNRLRMATSGPECWRCHRKMDPLGLVFERYDHYGRFQRLDAGQPVDPSGEITRTPFPGLHRRFEGPIGMIEFLARSKEVEQVFTRHVFRYFMGRNETLGDANTLQDAHKAYKDSGGSFNEMVTSILSSESFLYRQKRWSGEAR